MSAPPSSPQSPGNTKKKPGASIVMPPKSASSDDGPAIPGGRRKQSDNTNRGPPGAGGKKKKKKKKKGGKDGKSTSNIHKKKKTMYDQFLGIFGMATSNYHLKDQAAMEAAQALDLRESDLRKLRYRFDKIDIDGSGNIDSEELFQYFGETRSPFTDALFRLMDLDANGTIDFDEYVRVVSAFCMFSKDEVLRFCFECFDVDSSGTIDEKEFIELCKVVNNASPAFPQNFKKALEEFDVNEDGLIDYAEFLELDRRYPLVLFPAFRMQDQMQSRSLGQKGWLVVIENFTKAKKIEEYKAAHGGRLPPEPFLTKLSKSLFPCLYRKKVHIKSGAALEKRQNK